MGHINTRVALMGTHSEKIAQIISSLDGLKNPDLLSHNDFIHLVVRSLRSGIGPAGMNDLAVYLAEDSTDLDFMDRLVSDHSEAISQETVESLVDMNDLPHDLNVSIIKEYIDEIDQDDAMEAILKWKGRLTAAALNEIIEENLTEITKDQAKAIFDNQAAGDEFPEYLAEHYLATIIEIHPELVGRMIGEKLKG